MSRGPGQLTPPPHRLDQPVYNALPKINVRIGGHQLSRAFKYCWLLGCCTGRPVPDTQYVVSWSTIHFPRVDYSSYCTPASVGGVPGTAWLGPASQAPVRETVCFMRCTATQYCMQQAYSLQHYTVDPQLHQLLQSADAFVSLLVDTKQYHFLVHRLSIKVDQPSHLAAAGPYCLIH